MDPRCPRCAARLEPAIHLAQMCPAQHGVFVSAARLAHVLPRRALDLLREGPARRGERPCAACGKSMDRREVFLPVGEMEVDACPSCQGHWFDADELMRLTEATRRKKSLRQPGTPVEREFVTTTLVQQLFYTLTGI